MLKDKSIAVILAAGEGSRLRPFTHETPKGMLPVLNRPILEHILMALKDAGIKNVVMVVGYKKDRIKSYFKNGGKWGLSIKYANQRKQLGTLHALKQSKSKAQSYSNILVLPGDNLVEGTDISNLLSSGVNSALITESETPSKYGVCVLKNKVLEDIIEKPDVAELPSLPNTISTGIYFLAKEKYDQLVSLVSDGVYKMTGGIDEMISGNDIELSAVKSKTWVDIVYPWDMAAVNLVALRKVAPSSAGTVEKGVNIRGRVLIGSGSLARSGAYLEGPTVCGRGCDIGPGSYIGSSVIGDNTTVGSNTVVRSSVIMEDTYIGPGCTIENSVIGPGVSVGSNVSVYRGRGVYNVNEEFFPLEDIGSVVGPDSKIGANTVISPGSILGADVEIAPLKRVKGNLPDDAFMA